MCMPVPAQVMPAIATTSNIPFYTATSIPQRISDKIEHPQI